MLFHYAGQVILAESKKCNLRGVGILAQGTQ